MVPLPLPLWSIIRGLWIWTSITYWIGWIGFSCLENQAWAAWAWDSPESGPEFWGETANDSCTRHTHVFRFDFSTARNNRTTWSKFMLPLRPLPPSGINLANIHSYSVHAHGTCLTFGDVLREKLQYLKSRFCNLSQKKLIWHWHTVFTNFEPKTCLKTCFAVQKATPGLEQPYGPMAPLFVFKLTTKSEMCWEQKLKQSHTP